MARRFSVENTFFKNREIHLCRRQIKLRAAGLYFFTDSGGNDLLNFFEHFSIKKSQDSPESNPERILFLRSYRKKYSVTDVVLEILHTV